jgi:hypothetical protein
MNTLLTIRWRSFLGIAKVRLIQCRPGAMPVIPVVDLAKAIEMRHQDIFRLIRRRPEAFAGEVLSVDLVGRHNASLQVGSVGCQNDTLQVGSVGGRYDPLQQDLVVEALQPPFDLDERHGSWRPGRVVCLSYDGMVGLFFILNAARIKDAHRRLRILQFQAWARKVVTRAILEWPADQLPLELADIIDLRLGDEAAEAIKRMAESRGLSVGHARRMVKKAREAAGKPPAYRARKDRFEFEFPREAEQLAAFARANPRLNPKAIWRKGIAPCGYQTTLRIVTEARKQNRKALIKESRHV